jgi:hypothetical protein
MEVEMAKMLVDSKVYQKVFLKELVLVVPRESMKDKMSVKKLAVTMELNLVATTVVRKENA